MEQPRGRWLRRALKEFFVRAFGADCRRVTLRASLRARHLRFSFVRVLSGWRVSLRPPDPPAFLIWGWAELRCRARHGPRRAGDPTEGPLLARLQRARV